MTEIDYSNWNWVGDFANFAELESQLKKYFEENQEPYFLNVHYMNFPKGASREQILGEMQKHIAHFVSGKANVDELVMHLFNKSRTTFFWRQILPKNGWEIRFDPTKENILETSIIKRKGSAEGGI